MASAMHFDDKMNMMSWRAFAFMGFWVSGFLGFWVSGFLDFWISGFLDLKILRTSE